MGKETRRKRGKLTEIQTDRKTNRKRDKDIKPTDRVTPTEGQTDRETNRHKDELIESQTERETNLKRDKPKGEKGDRHTQR